MKHYEVQHKICRLSYTKFYLSDIENGIWSDSIPFIV